MIILRTILFASMFGGIFFILLPWLIVTSLPSPLSLGAWRWLGLIPLVCGIAVAAWCAATFATVGRGTTVPFDPPRRLVVHGLYRHSRNPMYIGGLAIMAGEVVLCESLPLLGYCVLLGVLFQLYIVYKEEPALARRFGASFSDYADRTPRWLSLRRR